MIYEQFEGYVEYDLENSIEDLKILELSLHEDTQPPSSDTQLRNWTNGVQYTREHSITPATAQLIFSSRVLEHLAGKHDQKTHGHRRKSGTSLFLYSYTNPGHKISVGSASKRIFGRTLSDSEFINLSGAPVGARVEVTSYKVKLGRKIRYSLFIDGKHPDFKRLEWAAYGRPGIKPGLRLDYMYMRKSLQKQHIGTKTFAKAARQASDLGIPYINLMALRNKTHNGYYTWPRIGFNSDMPKVTQAKYQAQYGKEPPKTIHDLFKSSGGLQWWKENGVSLPEAEFDLKPNSTSWKVLNSYMKAKNITND